MPASAAETPAPFQSSGARGMSVPMMMGPMRGYWWQLASGGKVMRLLLGSYEKQQSALFQRLIQPGQQVLDIGAAAGYYTLLAAKLVGPRGSVVAFEPHPSNLRFLRGHVRQNRLNQVQIHDLALSDQAGTARFGGGSGSGTNRLQDAGEFEVQVRRLDDLASEQYLSPQHLKIDVEGAEEDVLRGGEMLIRKHRPTIFLSTHGPAVHSACCRLLAIWKYDLAPIAGDSVPDASELLCTPRAA